MILVAISALLLGLAALGHLARGTWPGELALSLFPPLALASAVFAGMMLSLGRPLTASTAVLACALALFGCRALWSPQDPPVREPELRLVWANVFKSQAASRNALALATQHNADVVVLGERPADAMLQAYPHRVGLGEGGPAGTNVVILSRWPLRDVQTNPAGRGLLAAIVDHPSGPWRIIGLHPQVPGVPGYFRDRNAGLAAAIAAAGESGMPTLMVGDLNTVPWSPALERLPAGIARIETGSGSTWMAPVPGLGLPIDHAFVGGAAQGSARIGRGIGSDHLPLIVSARRVGP